jgi:lysyl-tRNA synthetase, class II
VVAVTGPTGHRRLAGAQGPSPDSRRGRRLTLTVLTVAGLSRGALVSSLVRRSAAAGVAAIAGEAVLSAAGPADPSRRGLLAGLTPSGLPSVAHVLVMLYGFALLVLTPRLWSGTRRAVSLAIAGLLLLAALNILTGLEYEQAVPEVSVALLLACGRSAFPLGCRNRPRLVVVFAALAAWAATCSALLLAPMVSGRTANPLGPDLHHAIAHLLRSSVAHPGLVADWATLIDILIACAVAGSVLTVRSLLRPAGGHHHPDHELRAARAIVDRHGEDSLSPFILRPDKAFQFAAGGVLAYRVIGETAIVSGDPVGPDESVSPVLSSFLQFARERGWHVVLWGASARHLSCFRSMGLRALCAGEEAVVDPARFSLEGRSVRKLRQSGHRVERRGWEISAHEGREIDADLEAEMEALELTWRKARQRLLGFAMGMGAFESGVQPNDLYLLARSPEGELGAVMRFISHCGKFSLDTMRRVGETPNGLNEALVCRALEIARNRGVAEVSLNYAGLGHLVRNQPRGNYAARLVTRLAAAQLGRRFQMERLVRFNEKFSPEWRPRYLIYESRLGLPQAVFRVLQAEGYLRQRQQRRFPAGWRPSAGVLPELPPASAPGVREVR